MQQVVEYQLIYKYCWSTSWNRKCNFHPNSSLSTGIVKKLLNITKNKKKKHDKILMFAKSKLNSIEIISSALIDMEISHEEFNAILKEKNKYDKIKDNLKGQNENRKL